MPTAHLGIRAAEIELLQTGAGIRGGHQPFDVSVLDEDLLDQVAAQLDRPAGLFHHDLRHGLTPKRKCSHLQRAQLRRLKPGLRAHRLRRLHRRRPRRGNQPAGHTTAWCRETFPRWHDKVCPRCVAAFEGAADGQAARLRRLASSMTKDGLPATPNDDASWVEALGWFAGWQVPLALTRADR